MMLNKQIIKDIIKKYDYSVELRSNKITYDGVIMVNGKATYGAILLMIDRRITFGYGEGPRFRWIHIDLNYSKENGLYGMIHEIFNPIIGRKVRSDAAWNIEKKILKSINQKRTL